MRFQLLRLPHLQPSRPGDKRYLILVPLTGAVTGLAAVVLVRLLAAVQKLFFGDGHHLLTAAQALSPLHRLAAPLVGGLLVGLLFLIFRRPVGGTGTSSLIEAVALRGGILPLKGTLIGAGATVLTVGSGGSLGREASLVQVGAGIGSLLGRRFGLTGQRLKILLGCGAAAGIAAAYNAPIGGAMFALEVVLGSFALESFGPIVVASAIGTVISRVFISRYTAYQPPTEVALVSAWDLGHHLMMGGLIGLASLVFLAVMRRSERGFDRLPLPGWAKPVLGFGAVGLVGVFYPHILGNGYDTVDWTLHAALPLGLLLALAALKLTATALTAGSGGAGGLFTPTLFVGSMLGASYGTWAHALSPQATAVPGVYALVGMGALLAGTTQAPLTAILLIFELTADYQILLPLMIACTAAIVVCRALGGESIYTARLAERGVRLSGRLEELVMDTTQVRDIMRRGTPTLREDEPLESVLETLLRQGRKEAFVVGADERFLGAITLADLSEYLGRAEALRSMKAGEVAYRDIPVLGPEDSLGNAIDRWSQVGRDRLPVIDNGRLIGELSAGDIITLYSQEVLHREARLARFSRPGDLGRTETTYVELPQEYVVARLVLSEGFHGLTLRAVDARRRFGVNVLEIKRRGDRPGLERRFQPDPDMRLMSGDVLIVVGRPSEIALLGNSVSSGAAKIPAS
jgi:chloride channel protein, CIC family